MRVIVTRPAEQAQRFVQQLLSLGVDAAELPLITIAPPADIGAVQAAWHRLGRQALVMFVSANAVVHFFGARPEGCTWPARLRAAATGPGTSAALRDAGVDAAAIDEPPAGGPYDTETLWTHLRDRDWAGCGVLVVRGEDGRDWLAQQLGAAGATVSFVAAYRRLPPRWTAAQAALVDAALAAPARFCWHFSSSEAIGHLQQASPAADWSASTALATHARIAARARQAGFGIVHEVAVGADALAQWLRGQGGVLAPIESRPL